MTGFGRAEFDLEGAGFQVEVRTVNHRHLDVQVRLPRTMMRFEPELRRRLAGRFARGKVEVSVSGRAGAALETLRIDAEVAARYVRAARELGTRHGLSEQLDAQRLLALPGVARLAEPELARGGSRPRPRGGGRARGGRSRRDAAQRRRRRSRRSSRAGSPASTRSWRRSPARPTTVQAAARERLRKRAEQLARRDRAARRGAPHPGAGRGRPTASTSRRSWCACAATPRQFRTALADGADGGVGRRLEFLLQEMLREANTVGSKAADAPLAHLVVDLKTELERAREQVLNVE